ncbi:MAG: Pilus assembly protein, Flp-type [Thermoanaerobacterales bacterium 50_218]|nr:MAG: Pilus assembly protein, Flp-type [Thermoanaerobacterales bacterium 50_218]
MVIALILAAVAAGAVYLYLQQVQMAATGVKGTVVVARSAVPEKTRITRSMVEQVEMPADYIHPRAARSLNDVVGAITCQPLVAGEQIIMDRIVKEKEAKAGLSYLVPQGKRAVTVAVDEVSAVGWHVRPGDHVDIIGTIEVPMPGRGSQGERENRVITVVALQDVEVLAVGTNVEIVRDQEKEKKIETKTVTLAVTLEEAKPLVLADEEGKIRMALRSPLEKGKVPSAPFELEDFLYLDTIPEEYHKQH